MRFYDLNVFVALFNGKTTLKERKLDPHHETSINSFIMRYSDHPLLGFPPFHQRGTTFMAWCLLPRRIKADPKRVQSLNEIIISLKN